MGLRKLVDTDFSVSRLEMGRVAISLLQMFDGFPLMRFEWIHLHTTVSVLPILCSTVSILPMVYSLSQTKLICCCPDFIFKKVDRPTEKKIMKTCKRGSFDHNLVLNSLHKAMGAVRSTLMPPLLLDLRSALVTLATCRSPMHSSSSLRRRESPANVISNRKCSANVILLRTRTER